MNLLRNWNGILSKMTNRQIDQSVSTAEFGDLVEFEPPWSGLCLWGVYVGDNHVIHFGVGDENMTQKACRSFLQQIVPRSKSGCVLRKTRICTQCITQIKVPPGTCIRVNNNHHNLAPSPQDQIRSRCGTFLHQQFNYDLMNFNSEHFATFVRYGSAASNLIPLMRKNEVHKETTQTLQMIMQQRMETATSPTAPNEDLSYTIC